MRQPPPPPPPSKLPPSKSFDADTSYLINFGVMLWVFIVGIIVGRFVLPFFL